MVELLELRGVGGVRCRWFVFGGGWDGRGGLEREVGVERKRKRRKGRRCRRRANKNECFSALSLARACVCTWKLSHFTRVNRTHRSGHVRARESAKANRQAQVGGEERLPFNDGQPFVLLMPRLSMVAIFSSVQNSPLSTRASPAIVVRSALRSLSLVPLQEKKIENEVLERKRETREERKTIPTAIVFVSFFSRFSRPPYFIMAAALLLARQSRRPTLELARRAGELGSLR